MTTCTEENPYRSPPSSGGAAVRLDKDGFRRFHIQMRYIGIPMIVGTILISLIFGIATADLLGGFFSLVVVTNTLVFAALYTVIALHLFTFGVSQDGIKCPDAWCTYRFAKWHEIRRVTLISFIGQRYLRISTVHSRFAMWMPLFVSDQRLFWS